MKLLYSRIGFRVIKYFATSPNFEKSCKIFNCESGKSDALQKKRIRLQCYLTISRRVTILYGNQIYLNENKYVLKDLNEVPPSDYWFLYEYIDAEVNNKV